jgi:NADH-quinone oxidoreductase subunit F
VLKLNELDLTFIDSTVEKLGTGKAKVLEILQATQDHYGFLPQPALERVCQLSEITPSEIVGVSSFYDRFRDQPAGRHIIRVCVGTACHIKGADSIYDAFGRYLSLGADEDTDAEGLYTLEKVACLGCCTLAPAVQIDRITYGHLSPDKIEEVLEDFSNWQQSQARASGLAAKKSIRDEDFEGEIRLGLSSCCVARGSGRIYQALLEALEKTGGRVSVKRVGCVGMCYQTPLLEVVTADEKSHLYAKVQPQDAKSIIARHFPVRGIRRRVSQTSSKALQSLLTGQSPANIGRYSIDVRDKQIADFLGKQEHLATEHCGCIDPMDIDEYLDKGGFTALGRCLDELDPEDIIRELSQSGLRGRGGAGYATHLKWQAVRQEKSDEKYIVCNGDEGDPGAFMDRMLMESYPYRIIEGIVIAAYAVGAQQGKLYIRAEYPLALERISQAIEQCRERKFLGEDILSSGFSLHLEIVSGGGAFVCGEETALLASIEGRRGMPRMRPPYPAQVGLWGKPTLINNVETYSVVPWILRNGAAKFAQLGTVNSKGTKVFALAGKVARGGLIEVPMGISIQEIIEDIGGGVSGDSPFKAVQIGGPSGGCVPRELGQVP